MIRRVTDPAELDELYSDDRRVHIYALADLDEPYWRNSTWYRRGDAAVGIVGLPNGEGGALYAVSTRDPAGCLALLAELADQIPAGQLVTGPVGLADVLEPGRPLRWSRSYNRFHLADPSAVPAAGGDVVALGPNDVALLETLYATEPDAAFFRPWMTTTDSFVGVFERGQLVAAAGAHVLSEARSVAAIGAVYTHPDHRGQGLGRAVTAGVIHRIRNRVDVIGLNVSHANTAARRVYEALGFEQLIPYDEAEVI